MAYAVQILGQPGDLTNLGLQGAALGNLTQAQINAELQAASDLADSYFRARWGTAAVPLAKWDSTVTLAVAKIGALYVLRVRGFDPRSTADQRFQKAHDEAIAWLGQVQRQQAHPGVTLANEGTANPPGRLQQPFLVSSSVTDLASGARKPNRGW